MDQPEPWYYGFLERYALLVIKLGIALAIVGFFGAMLLGLVISAQHQNGFVYFVIAFFEGFVSTVAAIIALLFICSFILLAVDAARRLRDIQRLLEK